ncbi:uncharacterized protein LOC135927181 [Gordionus sp. m RMFG-2023]|uniref:uncharacterized protein LOC135927181 n=1 Tax=Gordionus sp. m RMFG-2023 TaxID=3053472 RepID=UPI0031FDA066
MAVKMAPIVLQDDHNKEIIHRDFGINEKVIATVTDNGSNFKKAIKEFGYSMEALENDFDINDDECMEFEIIERSKEASITLPHTISLIATTDVERAIKDSPNISKIHHPAIAKCTKLWNANNRSKTAEFIKAVLGKQLMSNEVRLKKCKYRRDCVKFLRQRELLAKEIIQDQLQKMVKEEVQNHFRFIQTQKSLTSYVSFKNSSHINVALDPHIYKSSLSHTHYNQNKNYIPKEGLLTPKISSAFHCRLQNYITIAKKTLLELKTFKTPFSSGAFNRGQGMDLLNGRFIAQMRGIYHFICYVHVIHKPGKKRRILKQSDNIRLLICLNSQCRSQSSLEYISGFESNTKIFTIGVSGLLQMQAGEYASVFIDNRSKFTITIQRGSHFNGILLGI